ncbi:uncharacterized protein [Montipora capricornis]|uniref:uncharacterized protein n=1 Tax=Montipora capricornis TaxID=246305 RepID=UPI0035F18156
MYLRVLAAVCLLITLSLTAKAEKSKQPASNTRDHLCACKERAVRIQVNDMESPYLSCDKVCLVKHKDTWRNPLHQMRIRRESIDRDDVNSSSFNFTAACLFKRRSDPRLIIQTLDLDVTFHEKNNGSSWYALVRWDPIDYPAHWHGYCLNYVPGNFDDSSETISAFLSKNKTSVNITSSWNERVVFVAVFGLSMSGNDTEEILMYPHWPVTVTPGPNVSEPGSNVSEQGPNVSEQGPYRASTFVSIAVGTLVGVMLVGGFLWYFWRRKSSDPPLPYDFEYHAFIIHNHNDEHWMKKKLLPLLEEKHHLTCCIHYKDFIPGKPLRDNMADSVYTSYKVIAIFSNNFVNSPYCRYELDVAVNRLVQQRDDSLAVIRIDGTDCSHLPSELRSRCFIDYHFPHERPFWRRRLLKFLDLPEESRRQSTSEDQGSDNNNDESKQC